MRYVRFQGTLNSMEHISCWKTPASSGCQEFSVSSVNYRFQNVPPLCRILSQLKPVRVLTSHFFQNQFNLRRFYAYILHVVPFFQRFLPKFSVHLIVAACRPVHAGNARPVASFASWTWLAYSVSRHKYHSCSQIVSASIRHTWRHITRTCYYVTCRHLIKSLHYNLNTVWDNDRVTRHLKHIILVGLFRIIL
jgi:hypothetical protein